jgi:hypothetical protein
MEKISPDEILRKHGKWAESLKFAKIVAEKRKVSIRQARNIIKKESKKIIKHVYSDRTVIYGLPEFGPAKFEVSKEKNLAKSNFYRTLEQQFWKEHEKVMQLRLSSSMQRLFDAWDKTRRFAEILPDSDQKRKLVESIKKIHEEAGWADKTGFRFPLNDDLMFRKLDPKERIIYDAIPKIWARISSIIQGL